jgi:hypothetical protein
MVGLLLVMAGRADALKCTDADNMPPEDGAKCKMFEPKDE